MVLLDEVEKAHPEVFDILLQVLDDGRLTDGQGRTVDFRNVVLILTSNLGSQFLVEQSLGEEEKREKVMGVVNASFKPEFLNRLDDIVMFDPLSMEQLTSIVDLQIGSLQERMASRRLTLEVTDAAKEWLGFTGYDPAYAPGRCAGWSSGRSATSWPRPCSPVRWRTATPSWWTALTSPWRRTPSTG